LENLPSWAHMSACFSHHARAHAPGFLLQLERMPSAARLKLPPLPPYPIWSKATVALISSSLLRSLPSPESSPPLKQAIRMVPPPLPSSSNRLVVLAPGRAPIERLTAAQTEHVAQSCCRAPVASPSASPSGARRPTSSYATSATLAIPSASLCQARPSRLNAGPSALRHRLRASVSASGAAHHLLSRQRPGVHLDAAPSSHCQGRASLCHHQAATTLYERVCVAGAESALPVPLLPCLPSPCRVQGVRGNT
jgi:hypothetical protein